MSQFKQENTFDKRKEAASRMRDNYPERIPVIVEKAPNANAPPIKKKKFLVPQDLTVGKFVYEIRKHMPNLKPEETFFLFVQGDVIPPSGDMMLATYEKYKDEDGFLYITYSGENTFGY